MAGLEQNTPVPTQIRLRQQSRVMELEFDDGSMFSFSYEFLRVFSPSAEVRGHGPGQEVLQTGKRDVGIEQVEAVGHYAVRPVFTDGHDTGIYSWDYLYWLGTEQEALWAEYLARLDAASGSRDIDTSTAPSTGGGCGKH